MTAFLRLTDSGLELVVKTYSKVVEDKEKQVTLLPVMHMALKEFYAKLSTMALQKERLLLEGVKIEGYVGPFISPKRLKEKTIHGPYTGEFIFMQAMNAYQFIQAKYFGFQTQIEGLEELSYSKKSSFFDITLTRKTSPHSFLNDEQLVEYIGQYMEFINMILSVDYVPEKKRSEYIISIYNFFFETITATMGQKFQYPLNDEREAKFIEIVRRETALANDLGIVCGYLHMPLFDDYLNSLGFSLNAETQLLAWPITPPILDIFS